LTFGIHGCPEGLTESGVLGSEALHCLQRHVPRSPPTFYVSDEELEVGPVSDGSGVAVEATLLDAPVSSSEESACVDDILSKVIPR
jgi:hypothetical protein